MSPLDAVVQSRQRGDRPTNQTRLVGVILLLLDLSYPVDIATLIVDAMKIGVVIGSTLR